MELTTLTNSPGSIMLGLGRSILFSVSTATWSTLKRTADYRWAKQNRLARSPAMQFVGEDSQTITMSGSIYPYFKGGFLQVEAMRRLAQMGEPIMVVDISGFVFGYWVIEKVEETRTVPTLNGGSRKIDFNITISKYGVEELWFI